MNYAFRDARLALGLTQEQLAVFLNTTSVSIWRWERGDLPSFTSLQKICAFFQRNAIDLGFVSQEPCLASHQARPATKTILDPMLPQLSMPLIGRATLLETLKERLRKASGAFSLSGLPGIGKTALVQALAADLEIRCAFPDGILWMSLGKNPALSQQLDRWGRLLQGQSVLQQPLTHQPFSENACRMAWGEKLRDLLWSRRMLLIFDDVWSVDDLIACQVAGPQCCTLFTTRFPRLASCSAGTFSVPDLTEEESFILLSQYASPVALPRSERLHVLLQSVSGHPLALVLIGLALRMEGYTGQMRRIESLLDRLMHPAERLHLTFPSARNQTPIQSVFATIASSEEILPQDARDALRLLTRWYTARTTFSEEELVATRSITLQALDQLIDAGLLECCMSGWYRFHPIIASYAQLVV